MKKGFAGLLLAAATTALALYSLSCGTDSCRIEIDAAQEGDPISVTICGTCNKGNDPQEEMPIEITFLPNEPGVGCRCEGATCVFCTDGCDDPECVVEASTNEGSGCAAPAASLALDDTEFSEGARIPVTIRAASRIGNASTVVFLVRGTPTPTPTSTPTPTPTRTPTSGLPIL